MIRQPAIKRSNRGLQKASTYSLPAPVRGWNARDALASMKESDAVVMENWYPSATTVDLRKGSVDWATGADFNPLTLMSWNGSSSSKMFAATSSAIYDVTSNAPIGAAESGIAVTDGMFSFVNFSVAGGAYLIAVNGVDKLKLYDGSTWKDIDNTSTPAITGLSTTLLSYTAVIHRRVWFVQKGSTSAWYLPTASIGGALAEFPLGQVFSQGGYLVALASWTIDGGDGTDDYTVFLSSQGEAIVYKGTDPASATTFAKVGSYALGEPISNRCFQKYGGDLLVLCREGLLPLSKSVQSSTISYAPSLTSQISTAFNEATAAYRNNPGWTCCSFPQGSFVFVNVPISTNYAEQYVMNSLTGAWCKFTGLNATDWLVFEEKLYFSRAGKVCQAWVGSSDSGAAIRGKVMQAYSSLRNLARNKHNKLVRPLIKNNGAVTIKVSLDTDYQFANTLPADVPVAVSGALWDSAVWDSAVWASNGTYHREWLTVVAPEFYTAAFLLQCTAVNATIQWTATDFVYEVGGVL